MTSSQAPPPCSSRRNVPPSLFYIEHEVDSGGTRWPVEGRLQAMIDSPQPRRAGYIEYLLSRRGAVALIEMIFVERDFRRRGIAAALMNELHARHPRLRRYETAELLPDGRGFFAYYGPWTR